MSSLCINFRCLEKNPDDVDHCQRCGTSLLVRDRYRAIRSLRPLTQSYLSQIFEVEDQSTRTRKVLRVLNSNEPEVVEPLMVMTLALHRVHSLGAVPGIPRLEPDGFFPWRVLPDMPESHCLVMEKIEGENLDQWLLRQGRISQSRAIAWLIQLVELVGRFHQLGFLHRDIKPDNLIVQPGGRLALVDFDTVCRLDPQYLARLGGVGVGLISKADALTPGTPGYSSPEQSDGKAVPASDFFSIGRTFCHLLTGKHPIDLPRNPQAGMLIWRKEASQVDPLLLNFIDQLMAPNPVERPCQPDKIVQYLSQLPQRLKRRAILRSKPFRVAAALIGGMILAGTVRGAAAIAANHFLVEGNRLQATEDWKGAKAQYEWALWFEQQNPDIYSSLGMSCLQMKDEPCAIRYFQKAIAVDASHAPAHYNLANVYEQEGKYRLAEEHYRVVASSRMPLRSDAINNLARLQILQGQFQVAAKLLQQEMKATKDSQTLGAIYKNLGWISLEQGAFQRSLDWLQQASDKDPERTDTYCLMAQAKEKLHQDASADWTTCLMLPSPVGQPEVQQWKAHVLQRVQIR